jgi:hypothetical protein
MKVRWSPDEDWPFVFGLFVFLVALWAQSGALAGVFYDDGIYLVLARALAEGEGYRYLHLPGAPEAVHYPPLYPFALSLLWRIWPAFPSNLALFELFDSLMYAAAATVIARQVTRWSLPRWVKAAGLGTAFVAFPLLAIISVRFSEPLFLLLFASAISLADSENPTVRRAAFAGLLAGLATLTRSLGIAAVIGVTISFALRKEFRLAIVSAVIGLGVTVPWLAWLQGFSGVIDPRLATVYGSYGDVVGRVGTGSFLADANLRVFGPVARLLLPALPGILWWPLATLLAGLTAYGAYVQFFRARALVVTLIIYSSIVTVWPYAPDRFVWIVLPWWLVLLATGLHGLSQKGDVLKGAVAVISLVVLAGFGPREVRSLRQHSFSRTAELISVPFGVLLPSIVQELPADAVIASGDEALVFLYTGRQAVPASLVSLQGSEFNNLSPVESFEFYCDYGVTHVFMSGEGDPVSKVIDGIRATDPDAVTINFAITRGPALFEIRCL